jgi:hypothetical protein
MFTCTPSTKKHLSLLVATAMVLALAGAGLAPLAFARVVFNTIDPVATVTDNGRQIVVTGPITCDGNQRADLRVTVTQRSTGAVAEGRAVITCTGAEQQWEVRAPTQGKEMFEAGPATAVAVASTSSAGDTDDAHQWLVNITLVRK